MYYIIILFFNYSFHMYAFINFFLNFSISFDHSRHLLIFFHSAAQSFYWILLFSPSCLYQFYYQCFGGTGGKYSSRRWASPPQFGEPRELCSRLRLINQFWGGGWVNRPLKENRVESIPPDDFTPSVRFTLKTFTSVLVWEHTAPVWTSWLSEVLGRIQNTRKDGKKNRKTRVGRNAGDLFKDCQW